MELVSFELGDVLYESGVRVGRKMTHIYFPTTAIVSMLYVMGAVATVRSSRAKALRSRCRPLTF